MFPSKINGAAGKVLGVVAAYALAPVRIGSLLLVFREHAANDTLRFGEINKRLDTHEDKETARHELLVAGLSKVQGFQEGYQAAKREPPHP